MINIKTIKSFLRFVFIGFLALFAWSFVGHAKDFEIFDGRNYNGKYYPLIDNIETWDAQPHMEFHIHSKGQSVELTAVPGTNNGKTVLWLVYNLSFRGERVCRSIIAPPTFKEGDKVYAYKDTTNKDYDNIHVSTHPLTEKNLVEYKMAPYAPCDDEMAVNMPGTEPARTPAATTNPVPTAAAPAPAVVTPKGVGVDYGSQAVPFSF